MVSPAEAKHTWVTKKSSRSSPSPAPLRAVSDHRTRSVSGAASARAHASRLPSAPDAPSVPGEGCRWRPGRRISRTFRLASSVAHASCRARRASRRRSSRVSSPGTGRCDQEVSAARIGARRYGLVARARHVRAPGHRRSERGSWARATKGLREGAAGDCRRADISQCR
jgi:hypothetical protein